MDMDIKDFFKNNKEVVEIYENKYILSDKIGCITGVMNNGLPYECMYFDDYKKNKVVRYGKKTPEGYIESATIDYYKDGIKEYNRFAKLDRPKLVALYNNFAKPIKVSSEFISTDIYLYPGYSDGSIADGTTVALNSYPTEPRFDMIYRDKNGKVIKKEIMYLLEESDGLVKNIKIYSKSIEYRDEYRVIEVNSDGDKYNFIIKDDKKFNMILFENYLFEDSDKSCTLIDRTKLYKGGYHLIYKLFNPTNTYELLNLKDLYVIDKVDYNVNRIKRSIVK